MKRAIFIALLLLTPLAALALSGDFNGDGAVDFDDFFAFAERFNARRGDPGFDARFDLDSDGAVGFDDFFLFAAAWSSRPADLRSDPTYLDRQIKHLSDPDLFAAMDLDRPGLEEVKAAVARADYPAAYGAWARHWASRPGFAYLNSGTPFYTVEEARKVFAGSNAYTAAADQIVAHNIRGWGNVTIQHGPVVDFNADYGNNGKYGFHYWGWSTPLLWACLGTGKTGYLDAFDELFNQWYEQRDRVKGAFANLDPIFYELGLGSGRNRIFLDFYRLSRDRAPLRTHERLLKNLLGSARWLYELEKQGYRSGNWQVMGSYGLAEIGLNLPEFKESSRWVKMGVQRMQEHLRDDFFEDGCHSERCPSSYSTIVYRDPRNLSYLLERFDGHRDLAGTLRPPLEKALNFWMYMISPLGTQPAVNDGGRGKFDAAIFTEGGQAFKRPDLLYVAANLLGAKVSGPVQPPAHASMDFRPSGFAALRADWTRESPYMAINYGPYGSGHSHADVLSFELFAHGKALVVDAGIGVSYDDPLHVPWYITSKAHNMLVVEDENLDRRMAVGENPLWSSQTRLDYFTAEHRGYLLRRGVHHRRHFLFVRPGSDPNYLDSYFLIFDAYHASAAGLQVSFLLHTPTLFQETPSGYASATGPGLILSTPDPFRRRRGQGRASLGGVSSSAYDDITWVALDRTTSAGKTDDLAVLLYPFNTPSPPSVSIRRAGDGGSPGTVYLVVEGQRMTDHLVISDGRMRAFGGGALQTDATCALVRIAPGRPLAYALVSGSRLTFQGKTLFQAPAPTDAEGEAVP
ncbi:MAG: hypothetical protein A3F84_19220 [Candidatus Handelsmanbacteria bacterium RIFCSPLOWO2_12_FULL_64_10]|uniref:Uncharacterized protein n=1 Tax=Handelsmanbacteria sp. (strain RIFCSPLOWO2_12_FULL_64_10) TaxID=1817868 RepID=A0A1F6CV71_HANXR|nr:MAG: hypothetical protein A3F84_19220 [Candidatus Handelsmanbacteria bacterium RIFCSPLOWO2_12_FULL_64_10]